MMRKVCQWVFFRAYHIARLGGTTSKEKEDVTTPKAGELIGSDGSLTLLKLDGPAQLKVGSWGSKSCDGQGSKEGCEEPHIDVLNVGRVVQRTND